MPTNRQTGIEITLKRDPLFLRPDVCDFNNIIKEIAKIEAGRFEFGFPRLDHGKFQDIVDHYQQMFTASVDGVNVANPPTGSSVNPDVVFSDTGEVTVVVTGTNVPDGSPVRLRIVYSGTIVNLPGDGQPDVTMTGGSASFTATLPGGTGNIQAFVTLPATQP